jgi:translation elongation factor EF-1alpha
MLIIRRLNCIDAASGIVLSVSDRPVHNLRENWLVVVKVIPYPTAFPYGNGMVLHFYQQQESSTTKTVHRVINKRLKAYV